MQRVTSTRLRTGARPLAIALAVCGFGMAQAWAAGEAPLHDRAGNDVSNVASLQRGARNFVNYCMGCHSAQYVRYNQLVRDLGLSTEQVVENLMFAATKPTETMNAAMPADDAQRWFGQPPPDLSLIARARGADYLYNFLRAYYVDPTRPTGVNNLMLPNPSMPHVLWELQGLQRAVFEEEQQDGVTHKVFRGFEQLSPGSLTPEEYDQFVRDTVNFLDYIGEPMKLKRQSLGILVIAFLLVFGLFSWLLKKEIWKDIR